MKFKCLSIFGTRPEAIKMAPLVRALRACAWADARVCVTAQHREMLDQVLDCFDLAADFDLNIMLPGQDAGSVAGSVLLQLRGVLREFKPDLVLVHGDTVTTLGAALAAYFERIPVAHVEAGLRTADIYSPWPEEGMRRMVGPIAELHFAPTARARQNLLDEGVDPGTIHVTGNTVVDALLGCVATIQTDKAAQQQLAANFPFLATERRIVLVTGHRRENFGMAMERICTALRQIAEAFPGVEVVYPVHLNPNVREPVNRLLAGVPNIYLIEPLDYRAFVHLMAHAYLILTDSGGIQEEAPSLGKPVLVMRDTTERPEAIEAGTVKLVGTEVAGLFDAVRELLEDEAAYRRMSQAANPYGDGKASERIVRVLEQWAKARQDV
ncbi:UDP-N-acetylglucosamine 2-epimerase (non-hydrolyzing) [Pseudomonas mendocina]|nr:UDP-N-acetylglucosamine 2-epimerase (non-hydrolyzing) [Pseudomonas mendocina]MBH3339249.1 UDP-N-acetylglucosamine 2-epimerase (non-hydrolyzing) [Pseudomonas mendocina]